MAVDRLSVTVPDRLGRELRALAKARGANVSAVVTAAIEREVRMAALERASHEAARARAAPDPPALAQVKRAKVAHTIANFIAAPAASIALP